MANRVLKPDSGNDLLLQNNGSTSSIKINDDQSIDVTLGTSSGDDFAINSTHLVVEGDTGNVGLGTSSPAGNMEIEGATNGNSELFLTTHSSSAGHAGNLFFGSTRGTAASPSATLDDDIMGIIYARGWDTAWSSEAVMKIEADGDWGTGADDSDSPTRVTFWTTPNGSNAEAERMRIDSDGNIGINDTNPGTLLTATKDTSGGLGTLHVSNSHATVESGDEVMRVQFSGDNDCTGGHMINFYDSGGDIGRINVASASTVAYSTTSDYRLKENVVDIVDPITKLKSLKPKTFNFSKTPDINQDGFLAHELQEVVPIAVSGEKDAMKIETYVVTPAIQELRDSDGNIITKAVKALMGEREVIAKQVTDVSFLVPLLTGALQKIVERVEVLENA